MSKKQDTIGIVITGCDGNRFSEDEVKQIASRLEYADVLDRKNVVAVPDASIANISAIVDVIEKRGFSRVVLGGCSPATDKPIIEKVLAQSGLTDSAVIGVFLNHRVAKNERIDRAATALQRAYTSLSGRPDVKKKTVRLGKKVLVVGGGVAGVQTAAALNGFGYKTTLIEKGGVLGGELKGALKDFSEGKGIPAFLGEQHSAGAEFSEGLENISVLTNSYLERLEGHVGNFTAFIKTPSGRQELSCGSVVLAPGLSDGESGFEQIVGTDSSNIIAIESVQERIDTLAKLRKPRNIGLILDLLIDETKASTEMALSMANRIQELEDHQVHLFLREVRVASLDLEEFYDAVREKGVNIVKYQDLALQPVEDGRELLISCKDTVLGAPITVRCDVVGISRYGTDSSVDGRLAEITGVDIDSYGLFQANNIHLFPGETNRIGVYVAGAARGTFYIPDIIQESKAVAESVHRLLSQGTLQVEMSNAVVDPDKCVLCLTCIRSCPYKAMYIDHEQGAASSVAESCQRCGICAGECPAKAIELPIYSDNLLLSFVEQ